MTGLVEPVTAEDAAFEAEWQKARAGVDYFHMAHVLSGRLRRMDKRARASNARADAAEAEVSKLKAQVDWQPIETAPKDGDFLVWANGWPHPHMARRTPDGHRILTSLMGMTCWPTAGIGLPATHWRSISTPPSQARALSDEVNDGQ